ncbi:serine/threonine-protein kinase, partial [Tsukamurella soli]
MAEDRATRVPGPDYLVSGRYRLESKIGGGGMGAVWLAHDELLDREVAAKQVISTAGMSDDTAAEMRQRAMREGRIAARLSHRNAISMYDVALDQGEPWLVMEYLPSRSLAQVLHMTSTLPEKQVAQIGAQIADALAEAHDSGIIHRDIKPGNILIANRGRQSGMVKLTDFGISRAKDDVQLTQTGVITGTPAYFAPEVARGEEPNEASDLYSLGATLYTAIEGVPPFGSDDNSLVLLHRVARGKINPPTHGGPLMTVILAMLEPDPRRRPTLAQARDRLAEVAAAGG